LAQVLAQFVGAHPAPLGAGWEEGVLAFVNAVGAHPLHRPW